MEIVFHSHHATVSEGLRMRAVRGLEKLGKRFQGIVDATVRFEQDGPVRVVELVLRAPGRRQLVAKATGRFWGPTIADALRQLETQVGSVKRTRKEQGQQGILERRALGA